ncbi:hypothetical protein [Methylobacterium brachythecii]|uniref:Uncharacterized protein n=1 Tax=Methylobacterium brachythecii TaxID=1176177 RepID=A0A7W6ALE5_9HYPH|nr:hypothetical protein [Methylobacterium brachythecii]MBB3905603.1 hypothetical protein [Methylobacterium brachythecii]
MRIPLTSPPNVLAPCGVGTRPADPLPVRLDACLRAIPIVARVSPDPVVEALARALGLSASGVACRRLRLVDGSGLTIVVAEGPSWRPAAKVALLRLKRAASALGHRVMLLPDRACDRIARGAAAAGDSGGLGVPVDPVVRRRPRTTNAAGVMRPPAADRRAGAGRLGLLGVGLAGAAGRMSANAAGGGS